MAVLSVGPSLQAEILVTIGQNFTASTYGSDSDSVPPDSNGAAGLQHFVEFINGRFAVFQKSDGTLVQSMTDMAFWTNAGVNFSTGVMVTDPRLVFDSDSQRWFASMVDFVPSSVRIRANRFLVAVSDGPDPTGKWHGFGFTADAATGDFADFPTLGVNAAGVYLSGEMFSRTGAAVGGSLIAIPKSSLLSDPPSVAGRTALGIFSHTSRGDILQPAVTIGTSSTAETVLAVGDLGLDLKTHTTLMGSEINYADPAGPATLASVVRLTVPAFSIPINPPQPDGTDTLDDGDLRISAAVRQVGDIVYATHPVEVGGRSAVRWYRIRASTKTVIQTGTLVDDTLDLFYPSIAANQRGSVVIGCNGASATSFVSCYAAVGETIGGQLSFGKLRLLKAGTVNYQAVDSTGTSRWGDYSATTMDPADPNHFWTIQSYPAGEMSWATQVTELITTPVELAIDVTADQMRISWPAAATGVLLESASSLSNPDWSAVDQTAGIVDDRATVSLPVNGPQRFFRLRKAL